MNLRGSEFFTCPAARTRVLTPMVRIKRIITGSNSCQSISPSEFSHVFWSISSMIARTSRAVKPKSAPLRIFLNSALSRKPSKSSVARTKTSAQKSRSCSSDILASLAAVPSRISSFVGDGGTSVTYFARICKKKNTMSVELHVRELK